MLLKMAGFPTLRGSWIRSYCIPSCITYQPLPTLYTKCHWNWRNFCGRTFDTGFVTSTLSIE